MNSNLTDEEMAVIRRLDKAIDITETKGALTLINHIYIIYMKDERNTFKMRKESHDNEKCRDQVEVDERGDCRIQVLGRPSGIGRNEYVWRRPIH